LIVKKSEELYAQRRVHQSSTKGNKPMRKFLAVLILLAVASLWAGCGNSNSTPNATTNSTGTTTYNRPDAATSAPSGGAASNTAPKATPMVGIKPPTDK
jgi:hypothetical protein